MNPPEPIARVIRGETIESIHYGHIIVVDGQGSDVFVLGEPETVTFIRSAAKPFQFIPCLTSGAADAAGFSDEEVAIAVASHAGEAHHVAAAASILSKIGLDEADLRCGTHMPTNREVAKQMTAAGEDPNQLHNNCSGKHAAMLTFAKHIGSDLDTYYRADNRIQQRILRCMADFSEVPPESIAVGIDGCSAQNFALPLRGMARAFANLVNPAKFHGSIQSACRRIVSAMIAYPPMVYGDGGLDTELLRTGEGRLISKIGAEGVWLGAILPSEQWPAGLGIALKVSDGDDRRAKPVVAVELLRSLGVISPSAMHAFSPQPVLNRRRESVGRVEAIIP